MPLPPSTAPHAHRIMQADTRPVWPVLRPALLIVMQLSHASLIALSPRRPGRIIGTTTLYSLIACAYMCASGNTQGDCSVGIFTGSQVFTIYVLNWIANPIQDYRHERDYSSPAEISFLRRVWWAVCVINSPRGVGWSYEARDSIIYFILGVLICA